MTTVNRAYSTLRIFFDADDVLVEATQPAITRYNAEYGKALQFEQIKDFGMTECVEEGTSIEKYYDEAGFYRTFLPIPGMPQVVEKLAAAGHAMYVATSSPEGAISDKVGCYEEHFPYFAWDKHNIIPIHDKFVLNGDVLVDDKIDNVVQSSCTLRLLVDKPWNQNFDAAEHQIVRVYTPEGILRCIELYAEVLHEKQMMDAQKQQRIGELFDELTSQLQIAQDALSSSF